MWNPETNIKGPKGDKGDPGTNGVDGDVPEAPLDGQQYARQSGDWSVVVSSDSAVPSDAAPAMDSVAAPGTGTEYARGDHVHPSDTTKAAKTYVDTQDAALATAIGAKADKTYVDTQDTALATAISGKAPLVHTHAITDVTGLTAALDGKADDADVTGKVAKTGDTMSGDLNITKASPGISLHKAASGELATIRGTLNGLGRWAIALGDNTPEAGVADGSDFSFYNYNNDGSFRDRPAYISRLTNAFNFTYSPTAPTPTLTDDTTKLATTAFVQHHARSVAGLSANYTLAIGDVGKVLGLWAGSACTFTIPPVSSVAFPYGTQIDLFQGSTGQLIIAPGAGVTIISEDGRRKLAKAGSTATLLYVNSDTWILSGSLVA